MTAERLDGDQFAPLTKYISEVLQVTNVSAEDAEQIAADYVGEILLTLAENLGLEKVDVSDKEPVEKLLAYMNMAGEEGVGAAYIEAEAEVVEVFLSEALAWCRTNGDEQKEKEIKDISSKFTDSMADKFKERSESGQ